MTEPSIPCGTAASNDTTRRRDESRRIIPALEANTDGGHVEAIPPVVPLMMEGSVKPEHSRRVASTYFVSRNFSWQAVHDWPEVLKSSLAFAPSPAFMATEI